MLITEQNALSGSSTVVAIPCVSSPKKANTFPSHGVLRPSSELVNLEGIPRWQPTDDVFVALDAGIL